MTTVSDLLAAVDRAAPFALQESWDNSGLQLGDPGATVRRVLVALDPSPRVAEEARRREADTLVTHHPLFFDPLHRLTSDSAVGRSALACAAAGVAVISAHTSYDVAAGGLNDRLARLLGLEDAAPLKPAEPGQGCKLVTFVPEAALEAVRAALFAAGAGRIGDYAECAFEARGTGSFRGGEGTRPAVGRAGRSERVEEVRLETVVPPGRVAEVCAALREAHPYEEPPVDVYPLTSPRPGAGLGRVGRLPRPAGLPAVVRRIKRALGVATVEQVGRLPGRARVRRLAVVGGSGGSEWPRASAAGAQVLVTGEMKHDERVAADAAGAVVIVAGHYATERPAVDGLADAVAAALPDVSVLRTRSERDPTQWR